MRMSATLPTAGWDGNVKGSLFKTHTPEGSNADIPLVVRSFDTYLDAFTRHPAPLDDASSCSMKH
jgi:hypothetical protein